MKKRVWAALLAGAIVCASALAGGCAKETESGETLTVFNYGEYLDPEAIEMFTEETGIKILYEEAVTPKDLKESSMKSYARELMVERCS